MEKAVDYLKKGIEKNQILINNVQDKERLAELTGEKYQMLMAVDLIEKHTDPRKVTLKQ